MSDDKQSNDDFKETLDNFRARFMRAWKSADERFKAWQEKLKEEQKERKKVQEKRQAQSAQAGLAEPPPMAPRTHPQHTKIISETPDKVELKFPAIRVGWWVVPGIVGVLTPMVAFPIAMAAGSDRYGPGFSGEAFITIFFFGAVLFAMTITTAFPKVKVVATRERVKIGEFVLDRKHYGGLREGMEVQASTTGGGKAPLGQGRYVRLWAAYGTWGEMTPYLLSQHHAILIMYWVNTMVDRVGKEPPGEHDPEKGKRKQSFE